MSIRYNKECAKHILAPLLRRILATFNLCKSVRILAERFCFIGISYKAKKIAVFGSLTVE